MKCDVVQTHFANTFVDVKESDSKQDAKLGKREGAILQGEALINDASGVVSFQFAVAAAVTGAFSLANAATSFAIGFIGGIALGILLAVAFLYINSQNTRDANKLGEQKYNKGH